MARKNNQKVFLEKQIDLFGETQPVDLPAEPVVNTSVEILTEIVVEPVAETPVENIATVIVEPIVEASVEIPTEVVVETPVETVAEVDSDVNVEVTTALDKILDSLPATESFDYDSISTKMTLDDFQGTAHYDDRYVAISNNGLKANGFTYEKDEDFILSIPFDIAIDHNSVKEAFKDRTVYLQRLSNVDSSDETLYIQKNITMYDRFLVLRERTLQNDSKTKEVNKRELDELTTLLIKESASDEDLSDSSTISVGTTSKVRKEVAPKKKEKKPKNVPSNETEAEKELREMFDKENNSKPEKSKKVKNKI